MKKLSLKNLQLNASDLLEKEQLKSILGGSGGSGGSGQYECKVGDNSCTEPNYCIVDSYPYGHCGFVH